jgi:glycosyltransferase involved in cell wall biosynthesis
VPEPQVSVVIDTYNYGHFVEEAIESVLSQDFPADRMEILVVDDGSTDDTAERVKKYGARLQYFQKPNGGQASAFNFGLARARGKIIAFLDGDDYWFPDRLRTVIAEFEKHPEAGMVYHPLREYHMETGEFREAVFTPISGFVPSSIKQVILFDGVMTTSSFRRGILDQLLPIPEALRIQADAYLGNLAMFLAPVVAIDRPLGIYRIHGKNLYYQNTGDAEAKRLLRRIETRREIVKGMTGWLTSHGYDIRRPEIRAAITRWVLLWERDEFQLARPGRIRFFLHLLKSYRQQSPLMTPRIRVVNYFNALGVLIVGYGRFHSLDENREKITRWLRHGNAVSSYFRRKSVRSHESSR